MLPEREVEIKSTIKSKSQLIPLFDLLQIFRAKFCFKTRDDDALFKNNPLTK